MERERRYGVQIHHMMALCGGMLGVYAIISRMGVFASAQTANLIDLMCDLLGKDPGEISLRVLALVFYIAAMAVFVILEKRTSLNLEYGAILIDLAAVAAVGAIPETANPFIALYPIFFASSFQWCVFKGARGYVSATVFSTNNLKMTVTAFTEYLISGKNEAGRAKALEKALFFGGTLLYFHVGVLIGYITGLFWGTRSVWLCAAPLAVTAGLIAVSEAGTAEEKLTVS